MPTTTTNMGLSRPIAGAGGDVGTWATALNATIDRVDIHTHAAGLGIPIPSAGILIDANLTMGGYSLTNLRSASFTVQVAPAASVPNVSFWVRSSNNDVYYRDAAGADHRITNAGEVNVSATGGIIGDYAGVSAAVYYDDATGTYRFLEAVPGANSWSYVAAGGIRLYEHASGITNHIRLLSPAALAASYDVTMPAALPGSTLLQQVSSAGVVTWSNTIANAVAMSSSLTVGTTLGVTGLITATAGVTCAANQHVTVSGAGEYKHGDRVKVVSPLGGAGSGFTLAAGYVVSTGANTFYLPIDLLEGDQITGVSFGVYGDGAADVVLNVVYYDAAGAATVKGAATINNEPAAWTRYAIAGFTATTVGSAGQLVAEFACSAANIRIGAVRATYNRP